MNGLNFLARPVGNNEMASAPIKKMWEVPASPNQTDRGAKGGAPAKYRAPLQPKSGMFSPLPRKRTKRKGAKVAIRKSSGLDHWGGIQFREMLLIVRKFKRVFAFPKMIKKILRRKRADKARENVPSIFLPSPETGRKRLLLRPHFGFPSRAAMQIFFRQKNPPPRKKEERRGSVTPSTGRMSREKEKFEKVLFGLSSSVVRWRRSDLSGRN